MIKLLICGDNELLLKLMSRELETEGYKTHIATQGSEAIALLQTDPPDVLISDVLLPQINGFEFIAMAHQKHPEMPIIVVSDLKSERLIAHTFRLGAHDFISKPFDPENLKVRIKRLMLRKPPVFNPLITQGL